jgi:hypothetical protein
MATCLEPSKVLAGVEYACVDGKKLKGTLVSGTAHDSVVLCSQDNEKDCLTSEAFPSFPKTEREKIIPSRLQAGISVAGITGTLTSSGPADCAVDGATNCVATVGFPAVNLSLLGSSVLKKNVTVAGVTGDYPSSTYPLAGADGTQDLTSLAATTAAGTYEFFDSAGARYTGAITDAGSISIGTANQTFNASLYRQFTVPGDADLVGTNVSSGVNILGVAGSAPARTSNCSSEGAWDCVVDAGTSYRAANTTGLASKVLSGQVVAGESGNVALPAIADVKLNVQYGVSGTGLTGSYVDGGVADCTSDGQTNCKIPAAGTFKSADTSNFTGWDIRKKRNETTGAVLTFAGLAGQSKSCRNRARTGLFNNSTSPAGAGLDFFDTIDDFNNGVTGLPGEIPAWINISSNDYGTDFACGGIYATGNTASGNTGADATLAHSADGTWQDLTPGILPGGANSTNTNAGCNATDKHCVFRDLISHLMVTEVSAADTYTWQSAIDYCSNLGEAAHPVAEVVNDWWTEFTPPSARTPRA